MRHRDLALFLHALTGGRILEPPALREMTSFTDCTFPGNPGIRGVGHGLFLYEADGRTYWGHSGLMIGYESIVLHRPQTGTTVAVVGNVSRFNALGVALDLDRALDAPEGDGALQAPAPLP